jgi:hypothetical protein
MRTMTSAEQYRHQISALGLDEMRLQASSLAEAQAALDNVRSLRKQLLQIKRNINLDMKTIRAEYQQRSSSAAAGSSAVMSLLGKRKLAGSLRADEKRRLSVERDRKLAPYDNVKLTIDDLLTQMEGGKTQLGEFIEEAKAEAQAAKVTSDGRKPVTPAKTSTKFCKQCGKAVGMSDKFCRDCGTRLA